GRAPVAGGAGKHVVGPAGERRDHPRHKEQPDGPGDGDVAGTGEESDSGVALELGIKLDDRHGRLVPVGGGEDEALAFLEAETLVALAQTDVLDPAQLPAKIDRDLPASGRLLRQREVDYAQVARHRDRGRLAAERLWEMALQETAERPGYVRSPPRCGLRFRLRGCGVVFGDKAMLPVPRLCLADDHLGLLRAAFGRSD